MSSDRSSAGSFTARLEDLVLGRGRRWYRWVVRAVVALLAGVLLVDAVWLLADVSGTSLFSPVVVAGLRTLTAVALTLFLLTGIVQFLVVGRAVERGTETVSRSASELERAADEVAEAAAEVERLSDTVATQTTADPETDAVAEQADEIVDEMTDTERTASEVKSTLEDRTETLSDDSRRSDSGTDDSAER